MWHRLAGTCLSCIVTALSRFVRCQFTSANVQMAISCKDILQPSQKMYGRFFMPPCLVLSESISFMSEPFDGCRWWVLMRLRYAFLFSMVFITSAIYMLSIQAQLLLWVLYYSTTQHLFIMSSYVDTVNNLSRCDCGVYEHSILCMCMSILFSVNRCREADLMNFLNGTVNI